ncbi:hypothetical protein C2W62_05250 [Candidatus Entotheonella serta]|nr:hypothetical protein C2W62_05250 [Candidatus Entotheonella serta]
MHVERGLQPSQSAVTVVGISGCFNILGTREPALMVREIADALGYVGSNDYRFVGQPVCALNSHHAAFLAQGGYDKAQLNRLCLSWPSGQCGISLAHVTLSIARASWARSYRAIG